MNTQVVNFSNHELRVIENQAQKWFCARDIAKALEFKILMPMFAMYIDETSPNLMKQ